jgi:aspartate aminotransferase
LPTQGHASFIRQAQNLVFSEQLVQSCLSGIGPRLTSFQTVGGTGANHLGTLFLARNLRPRRVWIPHQTWEGHSRLWQRASDFGSRGQEALELRFYPYHDATNNCLDFQGMIGVLEQESEPDDILLLHACAHNPTGIDPSREQWEAIANFCSARNIFPFFDMA